MWSIIIGFVLGVVVTLAVQSYLLWKFLFRASTFDSDHDESLPATESYFYGGRADDMRKLKIIDTQEERHRPHSILGRRAEEPRRSERVMAINGAGWKSSDDSVRASSFQLPRELSKLLRANVDGSVPAAELSTTACNCLFLNLICQFLFKELRDTDRVRNWFMHKLSVEFEELLQRTTVGKLLEKITVRDLQLGHQFPVFKSLSVADVRLHDAGHIEELDVLIDLDYEGGFQLAVDADLVLQRSAFLAVRVAQVKGCVRLRFSRSPHTHWSFAFCDEPHLDVQVESHFQGRPLPHITSLIVNQIRRLVRKKHTLPNYKVRYRPFFEKPDGHGVGGTDVDVCLMAKNRITEGLLDVTVVECSRLFGGEDATCSDARVFCTLAVDSTTCVDQCALGYSHNWTWMTRDLTIVRQTSPDLAIGVTFRQEFVLNKYEHCVVVDSVAANSPVGQAGVRSGDILVSINGSKVTSASQATKLCKDNCDVGRLIFRIERMSTSALAGSLSPRSRADQVPDGDDASVSSAAEGSVGVETAGGESYESPLLKRGRNSPVSPAACKTPVASSCDHDSPATAGNKHHSKGSIHNVELGTDTNHIESPNERVAFKRTSALKFVRNPVFRETFSFKVENQHRFLNLCVWRRREDQKDRLPPDRSNQLSAASGSATGAASSARADILLGHLSISLLDIAIECTANSRGLHRRTFQLVPPEPKAVAHSRSSKFASSNPGFDKTLCYGDVTLSFVYKSQTVTSTKTNGRACDRRSRRAEERPETEFNSAVVSTVIESDVEDDTFSLMSDSLAVANELERLSHDFIITQFNSTTACHFCGKKVWFKIAFKCRFCALVCHKKCVAKCRDATTCCRDGVRWKSQGDIGLKITRTDSSLVDSSGSDGIFGDDAADRSTSLLESPKTQRRLRSILSSVVSGGGSATSHSAIDGKGGHGAGDRDPQSEKLVRTGSIHSLAPPGSDGTHSLPVMSSSKSLPPSPQTSPANSRKASLQGSPFEMPSESGGDSDANEDIGITIERLLQYANDETVVSVAKEKGRELFASDALDERKAKLDSMVSRLQVEIDEEAERRNLLAKSERESMVRGGNTRTERSRLASLLAKSDEKIQSLSILMLFYCSGLQHCHELEDMIARAQKANEVASAAETIQEQQQRASGGGSVSDNDVTKTTISVDLSPPS